MAMMPSRAEDYLMERKTENDLKDLLKTMVAFANSVVPGHTAVILIGERNDGSAEGVSNADNIQKRVRQEAEKVYPDVIWQSKVYEKDGKQCVRVEIEHTGDTPHFGGPAWVRRGSVTVKASDEEFQKLIDIRSSLVRELSKWVDKEVSIVTVISYQGGSRQSAPYEGRIRFVNSFFATLEYQNRKVSHPLKDLVISWDDEKNVLKLIVEHAATSPRLQAL